MYYEEAGSGQPVILVGGFTSTVATWRFQVLALAERYRVITPENRGSGRTRVVGADDGQRSVWQWADDLLAFVDALDLRHIHLAGCSMGGRIVQAFAVGNPNRLVSLALLCSSPGGEHAVAGDPAVTATLAPASIPGASTETVASAAAALFHPRTLTEHPEAVLTFLEDRAVEPHSAAELASRAAAMAAPFSIWDDLGRLSVPTLVITGEADQLLPPANSRRLADRIPGARLVLVEGGGHLFFMEQPDTTNKELLRHFAATG
jgi:pimeloyl-ACP methyl ester carboxylesterase